MGDDADLLTAVPTAILRQVRAHLACLQEFNAGIARWRALEQRVGGAGRYEYEYRLQREPEAQHSVAWLDHFATLARNNHVDPETVFAALGGCPAPEPWSPAAQAWQREEPPTEEQRDA
jgi:soluble lytic murein transglycosylase-like protein